MAGSREQADLSHSKYDKRDHEIALQAARESIALLKNDPQLLPSDKHSVKSILSVGPDTDPPQSVAGGSGAAIACSQSLSWKTFRALCSAVICAWRWQIGGNS
jgi:beta-glucosidase-like glycosyl hydrolase